MLDRSKASTSIQQQLYPWLNCYGCGISTPKSLHVQSFAAGRDVIGAFTPRPEHDNGHGYLHGGVIATILDCHSGAAALAEADRRGWKWSLGDGVLAYVTAALDLRFLRPTPLDETLDLWARVAEASEAQITVEAEIRWDGKPRAAATAQWKRWQPRPEGPSQWHLSSRARQKPRGGEGV